MRIIRKDITLRPDPKRVLFRPFVPKTRKQVLKIISRIMLLSDREVKLKYDKIDEEFGSRHPKIDQYFMRRFDSVKHLLFTDKKLTRERMLLIGAYFTLEYSFESSALFNPSMVWHPDQNNLKVGSKRFILSLRAVGEGHISSINFRQGVIDSTGNILIDEPKRYVTLPEIIPDAEYEKSLFQKKLRELGLLNEFSVKVLSDLEERFTINDLKESLRYTAKEYIFHQQNEYEFYYNKIIQLARSNYEIQFESSQDISERVIFPNVPTEMNGIEDARFVQFRDNGIEKYYATYTAFDGEVIFPQLLETTDFLHFKVSTLNGPAIQNKGMALFPRKINNLYAMLSRQDGENIFIMFSDMIHFWYTKQLLLRPTYDWEFTKIGNCGSPIETEEGWIVLSHGVGPMRKYALGAFLLDKQNPARVIGRTREPILTANENEREGYVPNVIYSCGGQPYNGDLIIPYAMSDYASSFAVVNMKELIKEMKSNGAN